MWTESQLTFHSLRGGAKIHLGEIYPARLFVGGLDIHILQDNLKLLSAAYLLGSLSLGRECESFLLLLLGRYPGIEDSFLKG